MITEKLDYQGLFEWDEDTIVPLEGSGIELKKGDLIGIGFKKDNCEIYPFASFHGDWVLIYTQLEYRNHDGYEGTGIAIRQRRIDNASVFVNNPPINIDLEEVMEDFKKECRTKLNKEKRKPGYYWVSDVKEPTKDDWYIASFGSHYVPDDCMWRIAGDTQEYDDNDFIHINENRLEYGN